MTAKIESPVIAPSTTIQSGSEKMLHAMQVTSRVSSEVLDYATSPLVLYFIMSNMTYSWGAHVSFWKSSSLHLLSFSLALPTAFAYWVGKRWLLNRDTMPVEEIPSVKESSITQINHENFRKEVLASKRPTVVDAYASWCAPCQQMAPIFSEVSQDMMGKIKFAKFDVDQEVTLTKQLKINAMPTLLFYQNGKEIARHVGGLPKEEILSECIKQFIPNVT